VRIQSLTRDVRIAERLSEGCKSYTGTAKAMSALWPPQLAYFRGKGSYCVLAEST
jgi:hypothetical protein